MGFGADRKDFARCDVFHIRLTRKNSAHRLSHQIFQRNLAECKNSSYKENKNSYWHSNCNVIKKNKLNNSSKWFTFGQKIRP